MLEFRRTWPRAIDLEYFLHITGIATHYDDPVTHKRGFSNVMSYQEGCRTQCPNDLTHIHLQAFAGQRVKRTEWFIEQENVRASGKRPSQVDALLHPSRYLIGIVVRVLREADQFKEFVDCCIALCRVSINCPGGPNRDTESDVLANGVPRQ